MKNLILYLFIAVFSVGLMSSCKSTKGCGLTSDTLKMKQKHELLKENNNTQRTAEISQPSR